MVKTPPFHGGNTGSNPVWVIVEALLFFNRGAYILDRGAFSMLTGKEIVNDSAPVLRQRAAIVQMPPSSEDQALLASMFEFIVNSQDEQFAKKHHIRAGIGLAAPQIGISKRMIAIHIPAEDVDEPLSCALFNPRIISHSNEKTYLSTGESCLSVDKQYAGYVPRYARIKVKANDMNGEEVQLSLTGLASICMQHEIDHLNGVLYYDHIHQQDPFKKVQNSEPLVR